MIKQKGNILIILAIMTFIAIGVAIYFSANTPKSLQNSYSNPSPNSSSTEFKTFQSKTMKFNINIPEKFNVNSTEILINLISQEGEIHIVKNGTQFNDLSNYLKDFDLKRNNPVIESEEKISINGFNSIKRIEKSKSTGNTELVYYIFVNPKVYVLSTDSMNLYSDLDQIAQSFRYVP